MYENIKTPHNALEMILEIVTSDRPADEVEIANICNHAISIPLRNCDVGTTDDKIRRFRDHCLKVEKPGECMYCHNPPVNLIRCVMDWMQLPYETSQMKDARKERKNK